MSMIGKLLFNKYTIGLGATFGLYKWSETSKELDKAAGHAEGPYFKDIVDGGLDAAGNAIAHYRKKPGALPVDVVTGIRDPQTGVAIVTGVQEKAPQLAQTTYSGAKDIIQGAGSAIGAAHKGVKNLLTSVGVPENWAGTAAFLLEGAGAIAGGAALGFAPAQKLGNMIMNSPISIANSAMGGAWSIASPILMVCATVAAGWYLLSGTGGKHMNQLSSWLSGASREKEVQKSGPEIQLQQHRDPQAQPAASQAHQVMPNVADMREAAQGLAGQTSAPQNVTMQDVTPQRLADTTEPGTSRRNNINTGMSA